MYIKHGGGYLAAALLLLVFGISQSSQSFSSWWLKDWLQADASKNKWVNVTGVSNSSSESSGNHRAADFFPDDQVISKDSPDFEMRRNVFAALVGVILVTSIIRAIIFTLVSSLKNLQE